MHGAAEGVGEEDRLFTLACLCSFALQEIAWANIWSAESFYKLGAAGTLLLFVFIVLQAGPPPSDPRCTLPWC